MTASDPRVGEIQADAVEAAARVMLDKMYDDKTLRVDDEDRDIMRGCLEAAAPLMHAYLLAELADRDEKLARVEALADSLRANRSAFPDSVYDRGYSAGRRAAGDLLRAAVATATGDGDHG